MMYHLLSFFLKLLSYIPFGVLYFLSDGLFCLLYYFSLQHLLLLLNQNSHLILRQVQKVLLLEEL